MKFNMKHIRISKKLILVCICLVVVAAAVIIIIISVRHENYENHEVNIFYPDYSCDIGFEGLRVKRTMEALGLGDGTGMGGSCYDEDTAESVRYFQKANGLEPTGKVDLETWQMMGYSKTEWDNCGNYRSQDCTSPGMSNEEKIEIMIDRACNYLNDPYVIGASGPAGPEYGLDCSGLVMQALYAAGVSMPDISPVTHAYPGHEYESRNIWDSSYFTVVDVEDRQRGDLVFYEDENGIIYHVSIYLGDDQVIESWPPMVMISDLTAPYHTHIKGIKRVFVN